MSLLSKRNGFPGWRHRPTRPILLETRRWTTVARILRILKIHRKSRKNRSTIIFSPMWLEQKGPFWRLRKKNWDQGHLKVCLIFVESLVTALSFNWLKIQRRNSLTFYADFSLLCDLLFEVFKFECDIKPTDANILHISCFWGRRK